MTSKSNKRSQVVLQLTDTHLHAAQNARMHGVNTIKSFVSVLNHAKRDDRWPPDAIVVTGDIAQDESRAAYENFRAVLEDVGLPVFCLPGNHDDPALMDELLTTSPFQLCGDVKLGGWRLILLNTFEQGEVAGALGDEQLAKLDELLSRHSDEHVLICMHHHPLPIGSTWLDRYGLNDAKAFLDTIDRHDQVRAVLWGHVHQASDRQRNKVRFLSTPSTCFQFLPGTETCEYDSRPPAIRWLTLDPGGTIETEVDWVEAAHTTPIPVTST